jgi:redox-sensitive bicupin YhaK (pirin superfamily)
MWDVFSPTPKGKGEGEGGGGGQERHQRIELFQLWVNSPRSGKFCDPQVQHLRAKDVQVLSCSPTAQAHIICGAVSLGQEEGQGQHVVEGGLNAMCHSPLAVMRLTAAPGERLEVAAPRGCTFLLYVRRGSVIVPPRGKDEEQGQRVRINSLVMFESGDVASQSEGQGQGQGQEEQGEKAGEEKESEWSVGEVLAGPSGLDALLLLGEPLSEPVVMGGPFVHASAQDYKAAADAFSAAGAVLAQQRGASSVFWPHTLSDEAWRAHVARLGLQKVLVDRLGR